jgi:hypothetical protein
MKRTRKATNMVFFMKNSQFLVFWPKPEVPFLSRETTEIALQLELL